MWGPVNKDQGSNVSMRTLRGRGEQRREGRRREAGGPERSFALPGF